MGVISRRILPVCGSMCVCCPALRSRSRQPVKRYKKLLADIFPKSLDGPPNERKIVKLCEYASKNPFRIPKIAKYLEERCYKEVRYEHIKFIGIVMEVYNKLLCRCKKQIAYFAASLLNVITEILDNSKQDCTRILGCKTLTKFICSQTDGTYTHNIEKLVHKICSLAREAGEEHNKCCLRASSLQCLSAMVWFMAEFSVIFADFDEIVYATLDNYEPDARHDDEGQGLPHHNWVDEVVRCEARVGAGVSSDVSPRCMILRSRPEKKDPSLLSREEIEMPKVWARICVQRMVEMAKESTTMHRVLDPMLVYFDAGRHWVPQQGLAMVVLSDMSYLVESSGNGHLILAAVIRHLDHKNVAHDLQVKSDIVQNATILARLFRSQAIVAEIGIISDLFWHLRKSVLGAVELNGQELNLNILLQNSIEDCLLEIAKGIGDARPLFNIMETTLEKVLTLKKPSPVGITRATIESLLILAHIISFASGCLHSQQVFPEALLIQLSKTMIHSDFEARIGAHRIFSLILARHEVASLRSGHRHERRQWHSETASAFASANALLEKLRREKDVSKFETHNKDARDDPKEREVAEEDWRQGWAYKSSPNFCNISSFLEKKTVSDSSSAADPNIMKMSEDQIAQLLSVFWFQAKCSNSMPSDFIAIAHSFSLVLISARLTNLNHNLVVRFFQLPLSFWNISLNPNSELVPSCQRSLFVLAKAMLMFAAKIYQIHDLSDFLKSKVSYDVDPYMGIGDDLHVYVKPQMDVREYGSPSDCQLAASALVKLRDAMYDSGKAILEILVQNLTSITELDVDNLAKQLSETFSPDDTFLIGQQSLLDLEHRQNIGLSKESPSSDRDSPISSDEDDAKSESCVAELSQSSPFMPRSKPSNIISVRQLLESALEVAGQVAGTAISTSPLPYSTMASQCDALGTCTRKRLSSWLTQENNGMRAAKENDPTLPADGQSMILKKTNDGRAVQGGKVANDPRFPLRLPPASPFDNFLKAAGC